jgi:ribosomal protein S18 acetylase RimI-like enzyme
MMLYEQTSQSVTVSITALDPAKIDQAADVLARGMLDNPMHIAVYGSDPVRRMHSLRRVFRNLMPMLSMANHSIVAIDEFGEIVGVCGILAPGSCKPTIDQKKRFMQGAMMIGPDAMVRMGRWLSAWQALDPNICHWHIGPLAVDMPFQGMGIGSALMNHLCAKLDQSGDAAYLETDDSGNVDFYKRFGFEVIAEQTVLGIPNWFMLRQPRQAAN